MKIENIAEVINAQITDLQEALQRNIERQDEDRIKGCEFAIIELNILRDTLVKQALIQTPLRGHPLEGNQMKQEIKWLIDDFVRADAKWEGDIIDLCDGKKDVLCYEWLRAYPSWLDDYLPVAITGTVSQMNT